MPKNKFQDVIFTLIMVVVMVYAMVIYNISLDTGKLTNQVFLMAFGELPIMGIVAFFLELFHCRTSRQKACLPSSSARYGQNDLYRFSHLCHHRLPDVPADELGCSGSFQGRAAAGAAFCLDSDHRLEFSHGAVLANLFCRAFGERNFPPSFPRKGTRSSNLLKTPSYLMLYNNSEAGALHNSCTCPYRNRSASR